MKKCIEFTLNPTNKHSLHREYTVCTIYTHTHTRKSLKLIFTILTLLSLQGYICNLNYLMQAKCACISLALKLSMGSQEFHREHRPLTTVLCSSSFFGVFLFLSLFFWILQTGFGLALIPRSR